MHVHLHSASGDVVILMLCKCKAAFFPIFFFFLGAIPRKSGLRESRRHLSPSPKSNSDTSRSQNSPLGARWGNIFNLNLDTIGPERHRKNGLGVLKPQKTSAGNTTFYKYKILASAAKFVISPLPLSLSVVTYTSSSFKYWATESKKKKKGRKKKHK